MKTYYEHLETTKVIGENFPPSKKPVFRSSAIFPVLHNQNLTTRILFLGYWILKRNISSIGFLYTLRSREGEILSRKYFLINSAKGFTIELKSLLDEIKHSDQLFEGSLELEIFSTVDLVFPYPAFVVHYYNEQFGSVVHTVGRIYNDIEDLEENEGHLVPEAGFDIYGNEDFEPFIALTNGPLANPNPKFEIQILRKGRETILKSFNIKELKPYETIFLLFKEHLDLTKILGNDPGSIKIIHNLQGFFPRFVAGNFENNRKSISITHTYYDSSKIEENSAYWNRSSTQWHDCSILIPLYVKEDLFTDVVLYPIFSPSAFEIFFHFYNEKGGKVFESKKYLINNSEQSSFQSFKLKKILIENSIGLDHVSSAKIICHWKDKSKIPTRLKLGLNVGFENRKLKLPCNICFAPQLGNPNILKKPGTFKWMPLLNSHHSEIVITNSGPLKEYSKQANVNIKIYREMDDTFMEESEVIPPNSIKKISGNGNEKIREFLDGRPGWITVQSDNPFIYGWYFDFSDNGSVAADHTF